MEKVLDADGHSVVGGVENQSGAGKIPQSAEVSQYRPSYEFWQCC